MNKIQKNLHVSLVLVVFCAGLLTACSPVKSTQLPAEVTAVSPALIPTVLPTATQVTPSILTALPNANYSIDVTTTQTAQLKNGIFEEPAAPGSASKITVALGKNPIEGDLNGDGVPDAAVTLIAQSGGSGTFTYLAAVINKNGLAEPLNAVFIGDRILVKKLAIQSGQIDLEFLDHATNEPLAAAPTLPFVKKFVLQQSQLVELK